MTVRVRTLKSMTGYGRVVAQKNDYVITLEIRSVNHRYLECSVRLPRGYGYLDGKIKGRLQEQIARGKIEVSLMLRQAKGNAQTIQVNHEMIANYIRAMTQENQRLAQELDGGVSRSGYLRQDLGLSMLLQLPDAFQITPIEEDADAIWEMLRPVLDETMEQLLHMRLVEGERLREDIAARLTALKQMTQRAEYLASQSKQLYYDKLYAKLKELLHDCSIDETRLLTEAAIVAEKIAVDEEIVRMYSHIAQFRMLLELDEPVGKKMDFLVQEMNREVNTTGSKTHSLELTRLVADMKSEIEKIREQIQNIE